MASRDMMLTLEEYLGLKALLDGQASPSPEMPLQEDSSPADPPKKKRKVSKYQKAIRQGDEETQGEAPEDEAQSTNEQGSHSYQESPRDEAAA